jgi:enamine deaminase RidA (YjgF/YER057c/UK114 family)
MSTAKEELTSRMKIGGCSPYEGRIGFSRAIRVGDDVFVSGTAPIGEDGQTACRGDAFGQALRCMEIIEKALKDAGAKLQDVTRVRMYIADRKNSERISEAFREVFHEICPAATMIVCKLLEDDWLVEMEADAIVGSG